MTPKHISGKSVTELYKYLQSKGGSYNDLRIRFQNSGIDLHDDVVSASTRNKDVFLDKYIQPLRLDERTDAEKLIRFIEQVISFPPAPASQDLLESLRRDGWQVVGHNLVQVDQNVEALIESMLQGSPIDTIQREWNRAISSVANDPADALTAASSMIEATYKFLLHDMDKSYPQNQDMRGLSKAVHPLLDISPDKEADEDFRALFQAIITISRSLGSIRTKIGDAHGASPTRADPIERHARLAVNIAGAVCFFLLETYSEKKSKPSGS